MTVARTLGNLTIIIQLPVIFTLCASKGVPNATLSYGVCTVGQHEEGAS